MTKAGKPSILTVGVPAAASPGIEQQTVVLSSLPDLFSLTTARHPDIVLVAPEPDWPDTATAVMSDGPLGVVVPEPPPASPSALEALHDHAARRGTSVIVLRRHAADDGWSPAASDVRESARNALLISLLTTVRTDAEAGSATPPLGAALLAQIALLRALLPEPALTWARANGGHYVATGPGGVILSAVATGAGSPGLELEVVGTSTRWTVRFDHSAVAAPTVITREDSNGSTSAPRYWESGFRAGWRALYRSLGAGERPTGDLDALAEQTQIAAPLLRRLDPLPSHAGRGD